ncbi:hypothetical protein DY000_02054522 [Brassica cretica]|uniref:SAM-dependent MTase RsmB/NOP-type domain-containing protein n=1 Tax=Brassica cretica TaxID=69181 RepID=A0ABQ7AFS8_BRACR|nr:hypothetical protein DY000_02054522 [Brassica cretica]
MAHRLSRGEKGKWIQDQPKQVKRPPVIIPASNNYALIEEHKRDPHRRYDSSQTTRDRPGRPSARERLSFTKESEAATHRENHSKSYTSALRTEWRPVIAGTKSSTPQRLCHSQATHTPSPRPQREGPSTQLVTPVANQRSEDRGNHSSERRSALERLSQPEVRIPLLQDGVANSASGRLQEVDIQYLEDNLNLQTSGGSCRPSGSKDKRPIGEVDQQGFTERSPIRSLSEDRIHVSLRLGPVNNPEPNLNGTGMMALRSADVPKLVGNAEKGKGKASLPSGSKKRIVRSPTQGVNVKKRRITKGQNSPRPCYGIRRASLGLCLAFCFCGPKTSDATTGEKKTLTRSDSRLRVLRFSLIGGRGDPVSLTSGRCSSVVDAMLLRYWEARNVKGGGELMWVDMLMLDIKLSGFRFSVFTILIVPSYYTDRIDFQSISIGSISVVKPQPGDRILNACAAPGGKTLFMASCLKRQGRLRILGETAKSHQVAGLITTIHSDLRVFAETKEVQYDKLLLDAPCSGIGVLSKRADLRWNWNCKLEDMEELKNLQDELLDERM